MKSYSYRKVDAFTAGESLGNPAAFLMTDADGLDGEQMQAIAREHAGFVSEMVFCSDSEQAEMKLTYYSSECEVDFCGHGTIATMYELIKSNPVWRAMPKVVFDTNRKGVLCAYNHIDDENAVYISAPDAMLFPVPVSREEAAEALSLTIDDLNAKYPLAFIDAGLRTLLVPVSDYEKEIAVYPDQAQLKKFCEKNGIDIILIFCMDTKDSQNYAHTRVFAPKYGYLEDPATGSGNSAFGNYLLQNKLWDGSPIALEQGGDNRVFNIVRLRIVSSDV